MEDMLRNITAGSSAAGNPLLRSVLGANASPTDYAEMAQYAESMWKMMDEMSEKDPEGYQDFIKTQAEVAREEAEKARDPHMEGLAPALVLEAQAQQPGPSQAGGGALASVANVVVGSKVVVRLHIWAATDASGVRRPHTAGGAPLSPAAAAPPGGSWAGLAVPMAEYRPAMTRPGPLPVHHFHVAAHGDAVRMCVADRPASFRAVFLEAASQFAEAEYRLVLSRTVRTLQVHCDAVSGEELDRLWKKQQEAAQAAGEAAAGLKDDAETAGSPVPKGLLEELRTMGAPKPKQQAPQLRPLHADAQQAKGGPAGTQAGGAKPKKALIEELD